MNTADRSLGYIDYAIRRRFAFMTLKADIEIVKNFYNTTDKNHFAVKLFENIYDLVDQHISSEFNLDDLMIGHSYFMVKDRNELQQKLDYEIKPLLLEYITDGILNVEKADVTNLQIEN